MILRFYRTALHALTVLMMASTTTTASAGVVEAISDVVAQTAGQLTVVIPPGKEMLIDGKPLAIFGNSSCTGVPRGEYGQDGCIVVTPATTRVMVLVADGGEKVWTVQRRGRDTVFVRPNGQMPGQP